MKKKSKLRIYYQKKKKDLKKDIFFFLKRNFFLKKYVKWEHNACEVFFLKRKKKFLFDKIVLLQLHEIDRYTKKFFLIILLNYKKKPN
jgi:hypothetical protein